MTWSTPVEPTAREKAVLKLCKKRPLYSFLRLHRHLIFDETMLSELQCMYSESGRPPEDPVRMALAMLLQVAFDESDSEVPTLTAADLRWRMVLGLLDEPEEPAFSQGTVFNFRQRAMEHGLARKLLEKTVEVARSTKGFSHKRLRAVFDSSPLLGAGRVEDTINLIGRAVRQLVEVAAEQAGKTPRDLATELTLPLVGENSVKASLDIDWRRPDARHEAVTELIAQFRRLQGWLEDTFTEEERQQPPLAESLGTVHRLIEQDTEPDPNPPASEGDSSGRTRIRSNRASDGKRDRQISVSDPDMRHGRKSKTKLFAGYKRHVVADADVPGLVCTVGLVAANTNDHEAGETLFGQLEAQSWTVEELHIDRGYLGSEGVHERRRKGLRVLSKPPTPARSERFTKEDFAIDFDARIASCPAGQTASISPGGTATFTKTSCQACVLVERCLPPSGKKSIKITANEQFFREMAAELTTPEGRAARRERIVVEHALAHVGAIQGSRARFRGRTKNLFDLERSAAVNNLHVIARLLREAA